MPTEISIDLKLVSAREPLCALADVTLSSLDLRVTIRRCAVFHKGGLPPWVNFPRLALKKGGTQKLITIIDLPSDLKKRVFSAVLTAYRRSIHAS